MRIEVGFPLGSGGDGGWDVFQGWIQGCFFFFFITLEPRVE